MNCLRLLLLFALIAATRVTGETPPSSPYTVIARYRIENLRHLSGITILDRQHSTAVAAIISDKDNAVFRLTVPVPSSTPEREISLKAEKAYLLNGANDCEDISYDEESRTLFIACEQNIGAPSRVFALPVDNPKQIRSYTIDSIFNDYNTGAEACAVVPYKGQRELWVGKERFVPPSRIPPVYRYKISGTQLIFCGSLRIDVSLHRTQSGMAYDARRNRIWVISRELHYLFATDPATIKKGRLEPDSLSLGYTWDQEYGYPPPFGMVEGIAFDKEGLLYVAFDNNDEAIGLAGTRKKKDPLLLVLKLR